MNREDRRQVAADVRRLTGRRVARFEFPGGKSRKSFRLVFDDGATAIATRRRSGRRGDREVAVMRSLAESGARVPHVLAYDGRLLVQQDLGEERLSERINSDAPGAAPEVDLARAAASLAGIHAAAARAGLIAGMPVIGAGDGWLEGLVARPAEIGKGLGIPAPDYDRDAIAATIQIRKPAFVKWDSRPGNALIASDGEAWWFDWEHCGARNGLDDLVWLLADEFVPGGPELALRLVAEHAPEFAPGQTIDAALDYFRTMAVFHSCVRLELIARRRLREGEWWSMRECLAGDRVGVTRRCARRLLLRCASWAGEGAATAPLAAWFGEILALVENLD